MHEDMADIYDTIPDVLPAHQARRHSLPSHPTLPPHVKSSGYQREFNDDNVGPCGRLGEYTESISLPGAFVHSEPLSDLGRSSNSPGTECDHENISAHNRCTSFLQISTSSRLINAPNDDHEKLHDTPCHHSKVALPLVPHTSSRQCKTSNVDVELLNAKGVTFLTIVKYQHGAKRSGAHGSLRRRVSSAFKKKFRRSEVKALETSKPFLEVWVRTFDDKNSLCAQSGSHPNPLEVSSLQLLAAHSVLSHYQSSAGYKDMVAAYLPTEHTYHPKHNIDLSLQFKYFGGKCTNFSSTKKCVPVEVSGDNLYKYRTLYRFPKHPCANVSAQQLCAEQDRDSGYTSRRHTLSSNMQAENADSVNIDCSADSITMMKDPFPIKVIRYLSKHRIYQLLKQKGI